MKTIVLSIALVLAAVLLLGVKVLFIKGSEFPSGHTGHSAALRRRGIGCASAGELKTNKLKPKNYHTNQ